MTYTDSITLKRCSKCRVEKPQDKFYRRNNRPSGYDYDCKECAETDRRERVARRRVPSVLDSPYIALIKRLFEKITVDPSITYKGSRCWLWTGSLNSDGYANFNMNGRTQGAHRVTYKMFVEDVKSADDQCDHLCRVRRCVNPVHLEIVDNRENSMRGTSFAPANAAKTHCVNGHPFDEKNTYFRKSHPTHRDCRTCRNEKLKAYYAAMSPQELRNYRRKYY